MNIVPILFRSKGTAEITDLFKCKRTTTSCCANSNVVHETLAQLYHNQPIPPHGHDAFLSHSYDSMQKYGEHTGSKEGELNEGEGFHFYLFVSNNIEYRNIQIYSLTLSNCVSFQSMHVPAFVLPISSPNTVKRI